MKKLGQIFGFFFFCLISTFTVDAASSVKTVKQQKQATQKEIKETNLKIKQNTAQTNRQLNQLNRITAEINEQGQVINNLSTQLTVINKRVEIINDSIIEYTKQLDLLKQNYAIAVRKMHSHSTSMDKLLFIFSSDSFRQALRRMRYLKEFSRWRERQSHAISEMQQKLVGTRNQLQGLLNTKQSTLKSVNANKIQLEEKKGKQAEVISNLKKEGNSLHALLKEKERKAKALDRELDRLIAEQERKAAERARIAEQRRKEAEAKRLAEERRKAEEMRKAEEKKKQEEEQKQEPAKPQKEKPTIEKPKKETKPIPEKRVEQEKKPEPVEETKQPTSGYIMDNEERTLSGSFENNKGRLLFPVNAAYKIVKPFGRQRHPELKYVETDNGGIDIETSAGANARAVFDGKVSVVFQTDGFNNVVMLRHGNYLTVYVNLSQIFVSSGQTIKAGQAIGKIFSDPEDENRTILHFEIRKEKTKLNPQDWLK